MHALSAYCQAEFVIAYTISAVALSITLRVTSKQQRFKKKKKKSLMSGAHKKPLNTLLQKCTHLFLFFSDPVLFQEKKKVALLYFVL